MASIPTVTSIDERFILSSPLWWGVFPLPWVAIRSLRPPLGLRPAIRITVPVGGDWLSCSLHAVLSHHPLQREPIAVLLTHPPGLWWSEEHLPGLRILTPAAVTAQQLVCPLRIIRATWRRHRADVAVSR